MTLICSGGITFWPLGDHLGRSGRGRCAANDLLDHFAPNRCADCARRSRHYPCRAARCRPRCTSRGARGGPCGNRVLAVHEAIYDQAFVQGGLGRGRGINRSATTPLEIFVYGNVPLPVPVPLASLSRWQPNRERMLLAEGGTHLTCSTSAATPFQTKRQRRSGASAICSTRTASAS